jgi:hypothetical protein
LSKLKSKVDKSPKSSSMTEDISTDNIATTNTQSISSERRNMTVPVTETKERTLCWTENEGVKNKENSSTDLVSSENKDYPRNLNQELSS